MIISKITVKNFRSIESVNNLDLLQFGVFVGQNNHGKTNSFEANEYLYKKNKLQDIKRVYIDPPYISSQHSHSAQGSRFSHNGRGSYIVNEYVLICKRK